MIDIILLVIIVAQAILCARLFAIRKNLYKEICFLVRGLEAVDPGALKRISIACVAGNIESVKQKDSSCYKKGDRLIFGGKNDER